MEEIRAQMSTIEDPRHPSYVKYALADILIIIMCGVLCGLDTLGDLVVYAKSKADFLRETFGIEKIPFKATFGRILSRVDGKQIGDVILDMLRERFGTMGEVIAVDGKAICSTARGENSHKALQILSTSPSVWLTSKTETILKAGTCISCTSVTGFPSLPITGLPCASSFCTSFFALNGAGASILMAFSPFFTLR